MRVSPSGGVAYVLCCAPCARGLCRSVHSENHVSVYGLRTAQMFLHAKYLAILSECTVSRMTPFILFRESPFHLLPTTVSASIEYNPLCNCATPAYYTARKAEHYVESCWTFGAIFPYTAVRTWLCPVYASLAISRFCPLRPE